MSLCSPGDAALRNFTLAAFSLVLLHIPASDWNEVAAERPADASVANENVVAEESV